ncbi:hypothetical protein ABTI40_19305, partial [Acinetobacter baumannii]
NIGIVCQFVNSRLSDARFDLECGVSWDLYGLLDLTWRGYRDVKFRRQLPPQFKAANGWTSHPFGQWFECNA